MKEGDMDRQKLLDILKEVKPEDKVSMKFKVSATTSLAYLITARDKLWELEEYDFIGAYVVMESGKWSNVSRVFEITVLKGWDGEWFANKLYDALEACIIGTKEVLEPVQQAKPYAYPPQNRRDSM